MSSQLLFPSPVRPLPRECSDTLNIYGSGIASTSITGKTLTLTANEMDTLLSVTSRGLYHWPVSYHSITTAFSFHRSEQYEVTNLNANYWKVICFLFQTALNQSRHGSRTQNYLASGEQPGLGQFHHFSITDKSVSAHFSFIIYAHVGAAMVLDHGTVMSQLNL